MCSTFEIQLIVNQGCKNPPILLQNEYSAIFLHQLVDYTPRLLKKDLSLLMAFEMFQFHENIWKWSHLIPTDLFFGQPP